MAVLGRERLRTLRNVYGIKSPTVAPTSSFSLHAHLFDVKYMYMTEILLIVSFNNQFTSSYSFLSSFVEFRSVLSEEKSTMS